MHTIAHSRGHHPLSGHPPPGPLTQRPTLHATARAAIAATLIALTPTSVTHAAHDPATSAVGLWRSVDDASGQPKSEVRITAAADGTLTGRVEKLLRPEADQAAVCDKCDDDRKNAPIIGLEVIRDARPQPDAPVWEGGTILDPEKGKTYTLRLTLTEQGQRLQVRGSFGPFWRTQVWQRVQ